MDKIVLRAKQVAEILDVSENKAYNIIAALNEQLQKQGFMTVRGRVNKSYFYEKFNYLGNEKKRA